MTASARRQLALAAAAIAAAWPLQAAAQAAPTLQVPASPWRYALTLYAYLPSVDGKSSVPADSGGTTINLSADKILDALEFAMMGSFDAHNGQWGVFTDLVYMDFSAGKQGSRDFGIGDIGLPANTTGDIGYGLTGAAWTLAGQYRLVSDPDRMVVDALGGMRYLNIRQKVSWDISGSIGPLDPARRSGSSEARLEQWDFIVGAKGRATLSSDRKWTLPFYLDIGSGDSQLTWQAAAGVGYAFGWGELIGMWRYLGYEMKSDSTLSELSFNGPMLGATFRW